MLIGLLLVLAALVPLALFYATRFKTGRPSMQWPLLAPIVKLEYKPDPPRLEGLWEGRRVSVREKDGKVAIVAGVNPASRLRVEIGPKDEVARRAGVVIPDPVDTGDREFEERLLARVSDKRAGQALLDSALLQRLKGAPVVDILGSGPALQWTLPELRDPDTLENCLDILDVIATEMERHA